MSTPAYYWLVAGQVVTLNDKGEEKQRNLNTLVMTKKNQVTLADIGKAQQALQVRFMTQFSQDPGNVIVDVFVLSISGLGRMTPTVFNQGFNEDGSRMEIQENE